MHNMLPQVIILILTFVVCWTPVQVVLALDAFTTLKKTESMLWFQIAANCLAYMNSVANPIIYTLLSAKFRHALRRITLCEGNRGGDANVVVVIRRADQPEMQLRPLYRGGGGGTPAGESQQRLKEDTPLMMSVCGGGSGVGGRASGASQASREAAVSSIKDGGRSSPPTPKSSHGKEHSL